MRFTAWVAILGTASILAVGGGGLSGCGSVEPTDTGTAGASGGDSGSGRGGGSGSGSAGTTGAGGTTGTGGMSGATAGTTGTGGGAAGGRGGANAGTAGTGGAAAGGRGGSDGSGIGGRGGSSAGTGAVGGLANGGGRGGGAGTLGTPGTGGVALGGRGGGTAGITGATGGTGGPATGGRGGSSAGTGGAGTGGAGTGGATTCPRGGCPALMIGDLEAIDDSKAPGFDAPGFRCKSLTICQASRSCLYFSTDMLGSLQSAEETYTDGAELATAAVKMVLDTGAASQCGNPPVTFTADEYLMLTYDGGKKVPVYLPMFMGTSLTLYIASDGSTFTDAALTTPARLRP